MDYGAISQWVVFLCQLIVLCWTLAPITIGRNVMLGLGVSLYTATHPAGAGSQRVIEPWLSPSQIGDECWLGGNVVVNPGVTIGPRTVVASGSIVTRTYRLMCCWQAAQPTYYPNLRSGGASALGGGRG